MGALSVYGVAVVITYILVTFTNMGYMDNVMDNNTFVSYFLFIMIQGSFVFQLFSSSFGLGAILLVLHILEYVRKTYLPKSRKSRKLLNEFIISIFLLSLVIIPPLSSQAVQKMLMQDPYFVIFAKEDGNSKLLVNLVHLTPFNDIKEIMFNEWTEVTQIHIYLHSFIS